MLLLVNPEPEKIMNKKTEPETMVIKCPGRLVRVALDAKLLDQAPTVSASEISKDGRKAKRVMRELVEAGFIAHPPKSSPHPDRFIVMSDAVLATIEATKPTLTLDYHQRVSIIEGRTSIGYSYNDLDPAEQLWVLTHASDYQWAWTLRGEETPWVLGQPLPEKHWHSSLMLSDQVMQDEMQAAKHASKVAEQMKRNVGWALAQLAGIDQPTIDMFMSLGSLGYGMSDDAFTGDPPTWVATMINYNTRAKEKLAKAQAQLDACRTVCNGILHYAGPEGDVADGWVKLAADLRAKVEQSLVEHRKSLARKSEETTP